MRLTFRLAMTLIALTGSVEAAAAERCNDSHEVGTMAMRKDMVGKARFNGEIVTNVMLRGLCTSGFVTRSGVTWIDWTTVDNIYAYGLGDALLLKIPCNGKFDAITYDGDPDVAMGIRASTGLMQGDCHDHAKFC